MNTTNMGMQSAYRFPQHKESVPRLHSHKSVLNTLSREPNQAKLSKLGTQGDVSSWFWSDVQQDSAILFLISISDL